MVAGWKLALLQTHGLACPGHLGAHITSLTSIVVCLIHYRDGLAGRQEALALESHGLGSMSGSDTCSLCNPDPGLPMYLRSKEFASQGGRCRRCGFDP